MLSLILWGCCKSALDFVYASIFVALYGDHPLKGLKVLVCFNLFYFILFLCQKETLSFLWDTNDPHVAFWVDKPKVKIKSEEVCEGLTITCLFEVVVQFCLFFKAFNMRLIWKRCASIPSLYIKLKTKKMFF